MNGCSMANYLTSVSAYSLAGLLLLGLALRASAQETPLFLANEATTVRGVEFAFAENGTFESGLLEAQIVTQGPGFFDQLKKILPFVSAQTYPLDRIELQKDVVRLRRFYHQHGFLSPWIDYDKSRLDTTNNTIRVVFSIQEGPPVIIQDVGFFAVSGGYMATFFTGEMRDRWINFRDRTTFKTGDRYTDFDLVRIQDQVVTWLKNQGYAFAQLTTETDIDSTANTADIRFAIDPGPIGYFDEIIVEGNESVSRTVIVRELPFKQGDRFSSDKLIEGQRELFNLNMFRVALAEVPPTYTATGPEVDSLEAMVRVDPAAATRQPRDSTVMVRFRLREANLRSVTAQTGYATDLGITLQGQWIHRNFFGGARNLTVNGEANTGLLATPPSSGTETPLLLRGSVALRQPYLFSRKLSGIVEPFILFERNPLLERSDARLGINRREYGVNTSLLYEILPFRTLSAQYTISQTFLPNVEVLLADGTVSDTTDAYGQSVLSLSATLGKVNNFLNPRRGFLVRPFYEQAGTLVGLLNTGITYSKLGSEVVAYVPLLPRTRLGLRLSGGRLFPTGQSTNQFAAPIENRFDPVRFYAGGASDVRGWDQGQIGPKFNRTRQELDEEGNPEFDDNGLPLTTDEEFEPVGGLTKLVGNIELRMPFPGLGSQWRSAVFLDFGQVSSEETGAACAPLDQVCRFQDEGTIRFNKFKFGTGAGIRYDTPVGYIRLDIAYKLNPDPLDLQSPRDAYLFREGFIDTPDEGRFSRFKLHLSLGQAF